jgi:subtilisin-like proprotein convertase family protein
MNGIALFRQALEERDSAVYTRLRRPRDPDGIWWLDVRDTFRDKLITVQWQRGLFGLSYTDDAVYGDACDEFYEDANALLDRVVSLILK